MTRDELMIWTLFASAALEECQRVCHGDHAAVAAETAIQADAMLLEWDKRRFGAPPTTAPKPTTDEQIKALRTRVDEFEFVTQEAISALELGPLLHTTSHGRGVAESIVLRLRAALKGAS